VLFDGELRGQQVKAFDALARHDIGVLAATTAFGKTVLAAWLIAQRSVNTLILVHRQQLLEQWIERLSSFLGLPAGTIGRLGGGRNKLTGVLDVALMQQGHAMTALRLVEIRGGGEDGYAIGNQFVKDAPEVTA